MSFAVPTSLVLADKPKSNRNAWIASFSNLSTAFNLVNINLGHVILQNQYCGGDNCKNAVTVAGTACLAGAILGQLTFGYVGDCLGRGPAMRLTMFLSIIGSLSSAFALPLSEDGQSIFTFLSVTRLILGVGVGGVYPLAATMAAESSGGDDKNRGRTVALVFSMQGVGQVLVPIVGLGLLTLFGVPDRDSSGLAWRFLLGIGALPGILLAPFKAKVPESNGAVTNNQNKMTVWQAIKHPVYFKKLLGTAGGWFIFDITFYGNALFAPTVLKSIFHVDGEVPVVGPDIQHNLCLQLLIVALIGLPGYYVAVAFMDRLGRKIIQMQGFLMLTALYGILAIWLDQLPSSVLLIVYGLTYFFSNFGPNSTTFILPSETFPFEVRSTLNGFSAAMGKLGAVVGSSAFKPIAESYGNDKAMAVCALCALLGFFVTVCFVEDRRGRGMAGDSFVANA